MCIHSASRYYPLPSPHTPFLQIQQSTFAYFAVSAHKILSIYKRSVWFWTLLKCQLRLHPLLPVEQWTWHSRAHFNISMVKMCAASQFTTTGARQHSRAQRCVNLHKTWSAHTRANPQAKCCNRHRWHVPINWSLSTPRRSSLVLWGGSSGAGIVRVSEVLTTPFRMLGGDQGKRGSFISLISQHSKQTHTHTQKSETRSACMHARVLCSPRPERKLHTKTLVIQLWDNNPPKVTLTQKTS